MRYRMMLIGLLLGVIGVLSSGVVFAQTDEITIEDLLPSRADLEYTGSIADDADEDDYLLDLEAGQAILFVAVQTDGFMDPYLRLADPNGATIGENDDFNQSIFQVNSLIAYIPEVSGKYTLTVTNYPGYAGGYDLSIYFVDNDFAINTISYARLRLSGPVETIDSDRFRVHFTRRGIDRTTFDYAQAVADAMEEVYQTQIVELGWSPPPTDGILGGDDRYDVYLTDLLGTRGILGYAQPELTAGDNPFTKYPEQAASYAFFVVDNDFDSSQLFTGADPISLMRATAAHEFHHIVQFGYDIDEPMAWFYESTASWMEVVTFFEEEDASGYLPDSFDYPEVCFGAQGSADPAGLAIYAHWLYLEHIATEYNRNAVIHLWENIREYDGFDALEQTLELYDDTLVDSLVQYHIRNLLHDYEVAEVMTDYTVDIEDTIDGIGSWSPRNSGVQELAVNFYRLEAEQDGVYRVILANSDNDDLTLWGLGINGDNADIFSLGTDGSIDTRDYEYVYVLVFNADYDNDVRRCSYSDYDLRVQRPYGAQANDVFMTRDASNFIPVR